VVQRVVRHGGCSRRGRRPGDPRGWGGCGA
jgi:hypothetical protein